MDKFRIFPLYHAAQGLIADRERACLDVSQRDPVNGIIEDRAVSLFRIADLNIQRRVFQDGRDDAHQNAQRLQLS